MCDKANSSTGCDVVYDLELEIDNLNEKILELESIIDDINLGGSL